MHPAPSRSPPPIVTTAQASTASASSTSFSSQAADCASGWPSALPPPVEDKPVFRCHSCDKTFSRSEHLVRHENSAHGTQRPYLCGLCGKSFKRSDVLARHVALHKNPPPDSTGASGSGPPKRPRLHRACESCSSAKVRCDGAKPACSRCRDKQIQCSFSKADKHAPLPVLGSDDGRSGPVTASSSSGPTPDSAKHPVTTQSSPPAPSPAPVPLAAYQRYGAPPPHQPSPLGSYLRAAAVAADAPKPQSSQPPPSHTDAAPSTSHAAYVVSGLPTLYPYAAAYQPPQLQQLQQSYQQVQHNLPPPPQAPQAPTYFYTPHSSIYTSSPLTSASYPSIAPYPSTSAPPPQPQPYIPVSTSLPPLASWAPQQQQQQQPGADRVNLPASLRNIISSGQPRPPGQQGAAEAVDGLGGQYVDGLRGTGTGI